MASSSSSGDLFMMTARNNGRAQPVHDADDEVELASSRPVPHSRPGRPKRPRDDLAQTLNSPSPDGDARKHNAPARRSSGAEPTPAPVPASLEDVDAWLKEALPTTVAPPRPAALTTEEAAVFSSHTRLLQELSRAVAIEFEDEPVAPAGDDDRRLESDAEAGDGSEDEEAEEARAEQGLRLLLRTASGQQLKFSVKPDTTFGKLFDAFFAKHPELSRGRTRFRFDGEDVKPTATPASLDIDDESIIDVLV